jgi:ProP effector
MTTTKENIHAALADVATRYPQTFVLEKYRPHRPLKVGIAVDIMERCPELDRRKLGVGLAAYTRRVMYLKGIVAGAARVDLDGNACGEVSAGDAEHAADAAVAAKGVERIAKQAVATVTAAAPLAVKVLALKKRPLLRLPAFRQQCG